MTCPRCGSVEVDSTTIGGILFPGAERFDDANRSTCQRCRHKGSTGDWERIDKLRAALREIGKVLDKGGLEHAMSCHGPDGCGCEIAELRAIVERAVGGES